MKKLLILPFLALILGLTGCGSVTDQPLSSDEEISVEAEVIIEDMEATVEELLEEEAAIDAALMELETEEF